MKQKYSGVFVPMVTPVTDSGSLDEPAARRIIEYLLQGGVEGIFVLGTTGEGASVPQDEAMRLVKLTAHQVGRRAQVLAGVNDNCISDAAIAGNQYLQAGADALVLLPPSYFALEPSEMLSSLKLLLDWLSGPAFLYNIPATTHCSLPLDVLEQLLGHPRLVGVKDSENNADRLHELVARFSGRPGFSVLIGVGTHMAKMLSLGADGIVPSVGNLAPHVCVELTEAIRRGDFAAAARAEAMMMATANLYQRGRTLGGSLAALKSAMNSLRLCGPAMLPPLQALPAAERKRIQEKMIEAGHWSTLGASAPDGVLCAANPSPA